MNAHKELAIQALERERFCLSRARAAFKHFSPEEMQCEYGQSGKTRQQVLNEHIERDAAISAAIEWVRRQDQ